MMLRLMLFFACLSTIRIIEAAQPQPTPVDKEKIVVTMPELPAITCANPSPFEQGRFTFNAQMLKKLNQQFKEEELQEIDGLKKMFIDASNPSKERCGATQSALSNEPLPKDTLEFRLGCMLTGFKDVYWGYPSQPSEFAIVYRKYPLLKKLLKEAKITVLLWKIPGTHQEITILYTPQGAVNALLLHEYDKQKHAEEMVTGKRSVNNYLMGMLLKYDEQDIDYFYSVFYASNKDCARLLEKEKKDAQEWLAKYTPIVEKMIKQDQASIASSAQEK